ncbi:translesion DNA synthesis-associated protein ImuA [Vibrio natriegens]|uniref:Recombinase RecA n=1 Tax=Vibrio natriegens NBRC 15636 = ATCC 14048 = DSM 759 TaxID=1219067 RepID=A0AAN1CVW2_VIBNA|nr:translesion DNA synthesis-associated protein ImuA [Vibrio natriegens]ALR15108.1 recombinase RecA [Vibrio natriegens NBRC 15636 = ATCC 14048 = DSM 759]ANQ13027.1 recombinase RecA [Vibrio natriegens NBRC 15636 = ATCC 14048 = DSM 759]EPM39466.1 recombinase RecA [Vibrio natriegens NBRC 15636 = ATCC 14048 = DSM 759]MDX6027445.1 translesion DNA synthesis-associated protein ImuA [Vibrio natriegens NBRC 15636 = ATCC 14048 = DSM 759]UUI10765.1 translesion DNA synthesis-associated protein ImuA [Vibri
MQDIIQHLKSQHLVWQANLTKADSHQFLNSSAFPELDALLGGGFPPHGVIEMESVGSVGELRLLAPYLKSSLTKGVTAFIQPPALMNPLFLHSIGLDINQVWVITPEHQRDALWAAEQCLKSSVCSNVLLWQDELEIHQVKRLQVASEQGSCPLFMLKPIRANRLSLPVSLSLKVQGSEQGVSVEVLKRKGGWSKGQVEINYQHHYPQLVMPLKTHTPSTVVNFPMLNQG